MDTPIKKQGFLSQRSAEMAKVVRLKRAVTQAECPWLDRDLPAGTPVFTYLGPTYGVVTPKGVAVTMKVAETPFFEIPADAIG